MVSYTNVRALMVAMITILAGIRGKTSASRWHRDDDGYLGSGDGQQRRTVTEKLSGLGERPSQGEEPEGGFQER
jgi:hypothetical protein